VIHPQCRTDESALSLTYVLDLCLRSRWPLPTSQSSTVPRINVERYGRTPKAAGGAAAKEFFASNFRYSQVEMTVDEDSIST